MVKSVNIDVLHVKPKYLVDEIKALSQLEQFTSNSMDARCTMMDTMLTDMDYMKWAMSNSKHVKRLDNYICVPAEHLFPLKPFNPNSKYLLETFTLHGFPMHAVEKFREEYSFMQTKMAVKFPEPSMVLMPLLGHSTKMMLLVELEDGQVDAIYQSLLKEMMNLAHWPKLKETHDFVQLHSTQILKPIQFDKIEKQFEHCKIQ